MQVLIALLGVVASVAGAPQPVPAGWSLHRRADPSAFLPLKFSLAQSNLEKLEDFLLDIADPQSPNYGQHWSPARVKETFRPSAETVDTVHAWLTHEAGIHADNIQLSPSSEILQLNVTVAEAERLLQAEYFVYSAEEDGSMRVGCHGGYTLPAHVEKHVDFVWPTVHFGFGGPSAFERRGESISSSTSSRFGREAGASKIPIENVRFLPPIPFTTCLTRLMLMQLADFATSGCDTSATLDCLRELYNFDFTPVSGDVNSVAVGAYSFFPLYTG
jgi:tripeptidyl-peptidase-1